MEKWDIYDENKRLTGRQVVRGEKHGAGEYNIVLSVWVINSKGEILTTFRHPDKAEWPSCWENPGGGLVAGETSRQGIRRELAEETGIEADERDFIFLSGNRYSNYFSDVYVLYRDVDISDVVMQPGETAGAKWVTPDEFRRMIDAGDVASPIAAEFLKGYDRITELCKSAR